MPTAFYEDFETDGNGTRYVTSIDEFIDGNNRASNNSYFSRTDDSDASGTSIEGSLSNTNGFWFGAADYDGTGKTDQNQTMTFSGIDISGLSELNFSGSFASVFNSTGKWDADTQVYFEVSIDGGDFVKVMQFAAVDDKTNERAAVDTDFDGIGDGATLSDSFASFSSSIAGTGSTLDLRVTFENLTQRGEDFHMDKLEITGNTEAELAADDLNISGENEVVYLDLLGNDDGGSGDPTIVSGGGASVLNAVTVTSAAGREGNVMFFENGAYNFAFDPMDNFDSMKEGETDTVTISYTVTDGNGETDTANVILTIEGEDDFNDNFQGDVGDNYVAGTEADDNLFGYGGNDTLDGGAGADTMDGGTGEDYYFIDNTDDVIVEAVDAGYDKVSTTVTYTLAGNVEMATARGSSDIDLTGNDGNNWLNGNVGNNVLTGLGGNDRLHGRGGDDTLDAGAGNDVLFGGDGVDTFIFEDNGGTDVILDYEDGEIIDLSGTSATDFDSLDIRDVASGAYVDYGTGVVVVTDVAAADLEADQFNFV